MRLIRPAKRTLFHQLLDYLREKPEPSRRPTRQADEREGVAAAAMTLRWGSYLAVLADPNQPLWNATRAPSISRISDEEMARINIEASAAMAEWIDLYRSDPASYARLVDKAVSYLPMPKKAKKARPRFNPLLALLDPEVAHLLEQNTDPKFLAQARSEVERHPSRTLANALVNFAWRNGPVENLHAGEWRGYPLQECRITSAEEQTLMRFASDRMAFGMTVCQRLTLEKSQRSWPEQVLPYRLATMMGITPWNWTLEEESREVHLPGLDE